MEFWGKNIEIKKDYYSFDLFNTLVNREVYRDEDVYLLVEKRYFQMFGKSIEGFAQNRLAAEKILWKETSEGRFTLNDIYFFLETTYDKQLLKEIKQVELSVEYEMIKINKLMEEFYYRAVDKGNVYITTDMYLEREQVLSILDKNKITGFEDVLISGERSANKDSGELFDILLNEVSSKKIVHIGDSFKGDYLRPKLKGISSILYKPYANPYYSKEYIRTIEDSVIYGMINAHPCDGENYWENVGYSILGPLLAGFVGWINKMVKEDSVSSIFFLSRDGYIIKKFFTLFFGDFIDSQYMFVSRKSAVKATIKESNTIREIVDKYKFRRKERWCDVYKRLGVSEELYSNDKEKNVMVKRRKIYRGKYDEKLEGFVSKIKEDSDKQREYLRRYIRELSLNNKVALVDVGWHGTIQDCLQDIMSKDVDFVGYYLGLEEKEESKNAYFTDKVFDKNIIPYTRGVFETFFSATHNCTDKYDGIGGRITPIFSDDTVLDETKNAIRSIHKGAMKFGESLKKKIDFYGLNLEEISEDFVSEGIIRFAVSPEIKDSLEFGNILFNDISNRKLVDFSLNMKFRQKIKNFISSDWKVGYMTVWCGKKAAYGKVFAFINKFR